MTQKILKEQFDVLLDAPESVSKLREMILQLAVMGKLVPQDPNDEPVTKLLRSPDSNCKCGARECTKTAGPSVPVSEPYAIPSKWLWGRLDQVVLVGSSSRVHQKDWRSAGIPFLRAREVVRLSKTGKAQNELFISESHYATLKTKGGLIPETNDILITGVGTIGVPYVVKQHDRFYFKDASVLLVKNCYQLNAGYLETVFRSSYWIAQVHKDSMGTTVHTLTIARARAIPIPLPPLAEQKRIVEKVDRLMAFCDELDARQKDRESLQIAFSGAALSRLTDVQEPKQFTVNLNRVKSHFDLIVHRPEDVKKVRETILQLAVMGKLVPQDPNDEPAGELLKRIGKEKERLVAEGKIKRPKELPPVGEDEKPFPLPKGWEWVRLDSLIFGIQAGWSPTCEERPAVFPEWGVLKVSAVTWNEFDSRQNKTLPSGLAPRPDLEIREGDFLITRANTAELVAKSVVVRDTQPRLLLSDKTLRVAFAEPANKIYVNYYNSSRFAREYYARIAGGTSSSMKNVSQEQIRALPVPVGPLKEQERINGLINRLMALCDELETRLARSREEGARLLEAVVDTIGK